jgi:hypothetical protein
MATLVIPNACQALIGNRFGPAQRLWTAFLVAQGLAFLTASQVQGGASRWGIAVLNGCLVFTSALGINSLTPGGREPAEGTAALRGLDSRGQRWVHNWL